MIDENQLLAGLPHFMDVRQLEKSYLQTLLLYELYARFEKSLVFKGGTALKFFYGLNRFSEDLDFTYNGGYETANLINSIESAIKATMRYWSGVNTAFCWPTGRMPLIIRI
ncbi:MAG: hypothetical protein BJBARM5_0891 [Candidatus Parvarchaeum acidophilus ARMAN-5]|uniref:Nucleotidyl transferase AbiEii/AbiGii toxin family protein n=1 Tax=Candidatus Parvarchaeum acidophilus ARMAN-5 TaxID=662762 RepID=D6GWM1_PARA5|nr:MAG: hypothetical protein BJBARM5_0891 [Candidatus Parvarchaeum acidophilus ARMAN-5]